MSLSILPSVRRAGLVLAMACLACASNPKAGGPGLYRGVIVSQSETGTLEVTVGAATGSLLPASGTIDFPGRTLSLTGTLDQSKKTLLTLTSSDGYQLAGQSRKEYVFGSFSKGQDFGTFALLFVPADGRPVQLLCGNLNLTSASSTGALPLPFAAAAVTPGAAICAAPTLTVLGSLDSANSLSCSAYGASFEGQVNADAGGQWGTGDNYGTWTLAPCAGGSPDGGVPDGSADSDEPDPVDVSQDSPADAGADSPAAAAADAAPAD